MKTRAELKAMAKSQIKGNIGILIAIMFIEASILVGISFIPLAGMVASFIIIPALSLSITRIYLALANTGKKPEIKDLFSGFDDFWTAFKTTFLVGLFTMLWSLLFYIPGIVKGLSYSQASYIVAENKGIGAREAINRSKEMMQGHKKDLFVLSLSFIGWFLVVGITFGIALVWVAPYMQATFTNFYNEIKPADATADDTFEGTFEGTVEAPQENF